MSKIIFKKPFRTHNRVVNPPPDEWETRHVDQSYRDKSDIRVMLANHDRGVKPRSPNPFAMHLRSLMDLLIIGLLL